MGIATSLSEPLTLTHRVPQGSILGFQKSSSHVTVNPMWMTRKYLSFSTKDLDSYSYLRLVAEDLHHVSEWCCANLLLGNPDKTKILLFWKETNPAQNALSFNEHVPSLHSSLLSTHSNTTSSDICIILHIVRKPNSIIISLFIQNILKFLTSLSPRRLSSNLWSILWLSFRKETQFFLADTPKKVDKIHSVVVKIKLFRLWIAVNAVFFSSLVNKQLL